VPHRSVRVEERKRRADVGKKSIVADALNFLRDLRKLVVRIDLAAVEVGRKRDVSERSQPVAFALHIIVESERLHVEQHRGMGTGAGRDGEIPAQPRTNFNE